MSATGQVLGIHFLVFFYIDKEAINNVFVYLLPNNLLGWMRDARSKKKNEEASVVSQWSTKTDKSENFHLQSFIVLLEISSESQ